MSGYWDNPYTEYLDSDNELCLPVITQEEINAILLKVNLLVHPIMGCDKRPQVFIDLEHLQIVDYSILPPNTTTQKESIHKINSLEPIRVDEMAYIALRSMIDFCWPEPESKDDVERAMAYNMALEHVLKLHSTVLGEKLTKYHTPLPYWGRLAFLHVMTMIPDEKIANFELNKIACFLIKDPVFNARSFQYQTHGLIGLNFALEPILKILNRMLLHFFHTESMAGPKRFERVWESIMPIAIYFWAPGYISLKNISTSSLMFGNSYMRMAHSLTANQIQFIIRHELGHLTLDHAKKLNSLTDNNDSKILLQREFEFAADAFAFNSFRSTLYSKLRAICQQNVASNDALNSEWNCRNIIEEHQGEGTAIRLLFIYMNAVDEIGLLLKERLGNNISFRNKMDIHPSPSERMQNLDMISIGEYSPTSKLIRYAEQLFLDTVEYAKNLNTDALTEPLRDRVFA